jgi:hypothetical protein
MELGPFVNKIEKTIGFDIDDVNKIDLHAKPGDDKDFVEIARFLKDGGDPTPTGERSVSGVNLQVEWKINIDTDEEGIIDFNTTGLRVWGSITVEDLPEGADPNNMDIELIDYEIPFDTKTNGFIIEEDNYGLTSYKRTLEKGIKCNYILVDFAKRTVQIGFEDYD